MRPVQIEFLQSDDADRVTVRGRVDSRTMAGFEGVMQALADAGDRDVIVDLMGLESFNSTGVGILVNLAARRRGRNAHVHLHLPGNGQVMSMLRLARLESLFTLHPSS
jgi:anti-anti-sigma factor